MSWRRLRSGLQVLLCSCLVAPATVGQDLFDLTHPRTSIDIGLGLGEGATELPIIGAELVGSQSGYRSTLRFEHLFRSQLGVSVGLEMSDVDDIFEGTPIILDTSASSRFAFVGGTFRATVGDRWRVPIRIGPYYHELELDFGDEVATYETFGLRLAAEPEWVLAQIVDAGSMHELSVFSEVAVGAGISDVTDSDQRESGYALRTDVELGVRYRWRSGWTLGGSVQHRKVNYSNTDSNDTTQFFGVDDDFTGFSIRIGWRG